jgi:hypothetical protein
LPVRLHAVGSGISISAEGEAAIEEIAARLARLQ